MMKTGRNLLVISAGLLVSACPTVPQMAQVDIGMSREQVIGIMGRPDVIGSPATAKR
jgi:starvation-inducible outer membrane lipoprotein